MSKLSARSGSQGKMLHRAIRNGEHSDISLLMQTICIRVVSISRVCRRNRNFFSGPAGLFCKSLSGVVPISICCHASFIASVQAGAMTCPLKLARPSHQTCSSPHYLGKVIPGGGKEANGRA